MDTDLSDEFDIFPDEPGDRDEAGGSKPRKNGSARDVVVRRLPIYARTLEYLEDEGIGHISSNELGERIGISAAQIRRDLAYFGDFGKQGKGYNVHFLLTQMKEILRISAGWNVAIVGMGHLGQAPAHYEGFAEGGFRVKALFDHDPTKHGQEVEGLAIYGMAAMPEVLAAHHIRVALLAVPPAAAQVWPTS